MNRKNFFKQLFGVAAVAVVAPSVLAKEEKTSPWGPELEAKIKARLEELKSDGYTVKRTLYPVGIKDPAKQGDIALKKMMEYYKDVSFTEFLSIF